MAAKADLTLAVRDRVHLQSLPGVVERLLQQCHDLGTPPMSQPCRSDDAVLVRFEGEVRDLAALRMYSSLSVVLGTVEDNLQKAFVPALRALRDSLDHGVLAVLEGGLTFRVDPLDCRPALIDQLTAELGWVNDPSDWDVNLSVSGGLLLAQVGALHRSRRHPKLRRVPASVNPLVAALLVRLLKPGPDTVVLDPFCGSGTLLVEADAAGAGKVLLGGDTAPSALEAARVNLAAVRRRVCLFPGRAEAIPLATGVVDRLVSNLPFGKRVGSHQANRELYPAFLAEVARVLPPTGRAVLLTEDKRLFERGVQGTAGLRVVKQVEVTSGGLHPTAYVITPTKAARRSASGKPARPRG